LTKTAIDCTFVAKRETYMSGTKPDTYATSTSATNDIDGIIADTATAPHIVTGPSVLDKDDNLMAKYVMSKLTQDGRVELLSIDAKLQFVAKSTIALKRGHKLSLIMNNAVYITEGDMVSIHITDVALEEIDE
jgi:hypothetical protein